MTQQDNKNTTRSTLTLKLKPAAASADLKTLALKQPLVENRRINKSSSVQVTIKGRKKDSKEEGTNLNNSEVQARLRAISKSNEVTKSEDLDSTKILNKAIREKKKSEIKIETKVEEKPEILEETSQPIKEEVIISTKPSFQSEGFDVMSKIKQSIAVTNREKEARDKIVNERKKLEQEKLEKERIEKEKKLKNKKPAFGAARDFESDKEENKKGKPNFKEERTNHRKLTYIIDGDDDGSDASRRRKKHRLKQQQLEQQSKEYKKISREVILPELITVSDLADRMTEKNW